ncbi:ABC transporter ATP-binding protein [Microvirga alba]|uniref:Sn-glycerol-3-phosphate ABC transporter ATP-binding protein UgpC n=1 Tax=Microvirga alba TaxID=2791025 RepID=A0A931BK59_9HYPH|nr:sn-glycerol-3-phosphate ABC transporter ATP-binding protein UgpC [Microvirga alba]MBF9232452.1 sn-glycerol-3-phosphate ABC transporter ATP-binding protein UgpC [Microvirga alba]
MTSLVLDKIVKRFGSVDVIHGVDLDIRSGEFVVFVGPSGCGKSTLLRMIAGLESISEGRLTIGGQRMNERAAADRGIAMVFQSYALYPHMSVYKNMAFGLETIRMPKADIEVRVRKAAEILRLTELLDRKPRQLSGGQRQRVAIGRAIVREPDIFLFDEPLSNLDAELRVQTRVEIAKLHADLGATMIYVTHDQVEAMTLADRIVVLRAGRVEQFGRPLDIYNKPANRFVAGFIGSPKMNFLGVKSLGMRPHGVAVDLAGRELMTHVAADRAVPTAVNEPLTLGVRPEHIVIGSGDGLQLGQVRAEHVEHLGSQTLIYGKLTDGQNMTIVCDGQKRTHVGDVVEVSVAPSLCHLFDTNGRTLTL